MTATLIDPRTKATNIADLFLTGEDGWLRDEDDNKVESYRDFLESIIKKRFTIDEVKSIIKEKFVTHYDGMWLDKESIADIEKTSRALESDVFEEIIEPLCNPSLHLIILAKCLLVPIHSYRHSKKYLSFMDAADYCDSVVIGHALVDTHKHYGSHNEVISKEDGRDMWERIEVELHELNVYLNDGCTDFDDVKALEAVY